jgi:hypothetical protein
MRVFVWWIAQQRNHARDEYTQNVFVLNVFARRGPTLPGLGRGGWHIYLDTATPNVCELAEIPEIPKIIEKNT